jgi:hypothetical protein
MVNNFPSCCVDLTYLGLFKRLLQLEEGTSLLAGVIDRFLYDFHNDSEYPDKQDNAFSLIQFREPSCTFDYGCDCLSLVVSGNGKS